MECDGCFFWYCAGEDVVDVASDLQGVDIGTGTIGDEEISHWIFFGDVGDGISEVEGVRGVRVKGFCEFEGGKVSSVGEFIVFADVWRDDELIFRIVEYYVFTELEFNFLRIEVDGFVRGIDTNELWGYCVFGSAGRGALASTGAKEKDAADDPVKVFCHDSFVAI